MKHDRFTPERAASEATLILGQPFSLGHEPCFFKPQRGQLLLNRGVEKSGGSAPFLAQRIGRLCVRTGRTLGRFPRGFRVSAPISIFESSSRKR